MIMNREEIELQIILCYEKIDLLKKELEDVVNGVTSEKQQVIDKLIELGFSNEGNKNNEDIFSFTQDELRYEVFVGNSYARWSIFEASKNEMIEDKTYFFLSPFLNYLNNGVTMHFIKKTYDVEHYFIPDQDMQEDRQAFEDLYNGTYEVLKTYKLGY